MKPHSALVRLALGIASLAFPIAAVAAPMSKVLFFTKSSGFEHPVIKRVDGQPSHTEKILGRIGPEHGIEFTFSKDGSRFSREYLARFDAVLFYTSGDLLSVGTDGQPAMSPEGKQALLDAVAAGMGFVGVHSASDTFHTGESGGGNPPRQERLGRYQNHGDASDPYIRCLGGEFVSHGPQQVATARVTAPAFPGFGGLGAEITVLEEWYSLKEFAPDLHVQLVMETEGMNGSDYERPPYPVAWARYHGQGRVAYNAMGHRPDVWESEAFQSMLIGALRWAAGAVDADVTPNLDRVAPGHAALPKPPAK